jgi:hypothetical protein
VALTKGATSIVSGQTTSTTTSAADVSDAYSPAVGVKIVQVGTATTAASFIVQVSFDGGTNYYDDGGPIAAGFAAATYTWVINLLPPVTNVRLVYTQQAGGTSSTLSAQAGEVTAL